MEIEGLSSKSENVQRKLHSSAQGQTQPKVELFFESKRQKLSFALGKKGGEQKSGWTCRNGGEGDRNRDKDCEIKYETGAFKKISSTKRSIKSSDVFF